ncbi:uncharacterized protein J3D65DRAFT_468433 [Phyllosticta citribraziliensis]|uniref:Uncharacterized protein n=1 Tax=Phyllosticta citribraziliensis TaxID=989973 RepID=A0ABR1LFQ4_9PEZI
MSNLAATVARLLGLGLAALSAQVTLLTAVVASRGALGGAVASLVADITAFSRLALAHAGLLRENSERDDEAITPEPLRGTDKDNERHEVGKEVVDARSYEREIGLKARVACSVPTRSIDDVGIGAWSANTTTPTRIKDLFRIEQPKKASPLEVRLNTGLERGRRGLCMCSQECLGGGAKSRGRRATRTQRV